LALGKSSKYYGFHIVLLAAGEALSYVSGGTLWSYELYSKGRGIFSRKASLPVQAA
jgi:hypothetical protein